MDKKRERIYLLHEIATAELRLAQMDWQEVAEEAYPFIANGELLPDDLRVALHDAHIMLENAKEKEKTALEDYNGILYPRGGLGDAEN